MAAIKRTRVLGKCWEESLLSIFVCFAIFLCFCVLERNLEMPFQAFWAQNYFCLDMLKKFIFFTFRCFFLEGGRGSVYNCEIWYKLRIVYVGILKVSHYIHCGLPDQFLKVYFKMFLLVRWHLRYILVKNSIIQKDVKWNPSHTPTFTLQFNFCPQD